MYNTWQHQREEEIRPKKNKKKKMHGTLKYYTAHTHTHTDVLIVSRPWHPLVPVPRVNNYTTHLAFSTPRRFFFFFCFSPSLNTNEQKILTHTKKASLTMASLHTRVCVCVRYYTFQKNEYWTKVGKENTIMDQEHSSDAMFVQNMIHLSLRRV